jgi:uncharacterized protein
VSTTSAPREHRAAHNDVATAKIDADVHPLVSSREVLKRYMASRFHGELDQVAGRELYLPVTIGARQARSFHREDAFPPSGGPPGSDPAFFSEQLLDPYGIAIAILGPLDHVGIAPYGDFGLAIASAVNDWMHDEWCANDPRYRACIAVPGEDAERAAGEIRRLAGKPAFVQVVLLLPSPDPLGHPRYWPIYEAAAEAGLPVALHPGGFSGGLTGAGFPTYFLEFHVSLPFAYSTAVVSLVGSGIFDRLPGLQIVLQEGAISWMVPLMARMDRARASMRAQLPHLRDRPSDVIRSHFWFTTQPLEEPDDPSHLLEMFEQLDMSNRVMFASDYPHWDFDSPERTLPAAIGGELRRKFFADNACALYGFEIGG